MEIARALAVHAPAGRGAAVRVKLLFLDEIGAFVRRQRGFTACWYLVPHTARLVGDLVHEIAQEFKLLERCPLGIELQMDGFHVLANQQINMLRDNDTLAVQCSEFVGEGEESPAKPLRNSSSKKRTREEPQSVPTGKASKKTAKRAKRDKTAIAKTSKKGGESSTKRAAASPLKPHAFAATQKATKPAVSRAVLESSSDDSSSSSDSSSSDDEDEKALKSLPRKVSTHDFHKVVKETVNRMKQDVSILSTPSSGAVDSSSSSSIDSESDSNSDDDTKKPASKPVTNGVKSKQGNEQLNGSKETRARRRRRPRRRPKNGSTAPYETRGVKPQQKVEEKHGQARNPQMTSASADPKEIRPLRIRGVRPTTKSRETNHVRFDAPQNATTTSGEQPTTTAADLEKYGPRSTNARTKRTPHTHSLPARNEDSEASESGTRKPVKEMWKRPYEIISSIHDVKAQPDAADKTPTLESLVAAYPTKPSDASTLPTPSGLQTDDIVAYKTLTLCMETFQPVVSDWLCGQIVDVIDTDRTVTVIPYTWVKPKAPKDKLVWSPSQPQLGEDACVSVNQNEITELRFLHGPTKDHLDASA